MFKHLKFYQLPILSGILIGTSYIPLPPWALAFFYVPVWLFVVQQDKTWKQVFWAGWWSQFLLSLIGFHWIASTAHDFGYLPWVVSVLILLIFAGFMHLYIPLSMVISWKLAQSFKLKTSALIFLFPAFLTLGEMYWPNIFQWNMGYPLFWIKLPIYQWADVIGFQGLSFGVYLFNAWVTWLIVKKDKSLALKTSVAVLGLLIALTVAGKSRGEHWKTTDAELKALMIQANIGNNEKRSQEKKARSGNSVVEDFFDLTESGLAENPDTQLIIWPETAYPYIMDRVSGARNRNLSYFIQKIHTPLFTGAFSADPDKPGRNIYNSVFLFDANGEMMGPPYRKTKLLIFGEKLPFVDTFPILAKLNPGGGAGFGMGGGPMIMNMGDLHIGPQICYESLYPDFSAMLADLGAHVIINVSNDSWFGQTFEPHQHMFMTFARAIEVRRPLLRSTNTGISGAVLADGTVLEQSPLGKVWTHQYTIPYLKNAPFTFYAKYGDWLWVLVVISILSALVAGKKRVYNEAN